MPLEGLVPDRGAISALWPPSRQPAPKVRAFVEFLESLLKEVSVRSGRSVHA